MSEDHVIYCNHLNLQIVVQALFEPVVTEGDDFNDIGGGRPSDCTKEMNTTVQGLKYI